MTVFIANYPDATDDGVAYNRQKTAIESAIQAYGTDHIGGVTVGNEFILEYVYHTQRNVIATDNIH